MSVKVRFINLQVWLNNSVTRDNDLREGIPPYTLGPLAVSYFELFLKRLVQQPIRLQLGNT